MTAGQQSYERRRVRSRPDYLASAARLVAFALTVAAVGGSAITLLTSIGEAAVYISGGIAIVAALALGAAAQKYDADANVLAREVARLEAELRAARDRIRDEDEKAAIDQVLADLSTLMPSEPRSGPVARLMMRLRPGR
jgi:hypothetical protein